MEGVARNGLPPLPRGAVAADLRHGPHSWLYKDTFRCKTRQAARTMENGQMTIRVAVYPNLNLHVMKPGAILRDLQLDAFK